MAYCKNIDCEYNDDGLTCEYEKPLSLDDNGVCENFRYKTEGNDEG